MTIIAVSAILTGLNMLLNSKFKPIETEIAKIEKIQTGITEIKSLLKYHSHNPPKQAKK